MVTILLKFSDQPIGTNDQEQSDQSLRCLLFHCIISRYHKMVKPLSYAPAFRRMRKGIKRCPCPSVRPSSCPSVRPSFKWVLYERNSSYNFIPILLKLYRCFCQGLKMCMTFGYNPQINFCHSLNLVIFGLNYY